MSVARFPRCWKAVLVVSCYFVMHSVSFAAWPLGGAIDLSSGFGDYRTGRFHAGLDLRTGGAIGKPVKSPVNGYISRIRLSYTGYGKGLYLQGDDGYTYVFGHLSKYNPQLEKLVTDRQVLLRRYSIDLDLLKDSIRVKDGELLAYSGQTGAGAPHLHFEKRAPDNLPINPLTHGFSLKDKVRPTFERVGFQLADDHSLFSDATRRIFLPVKPAGKAGAFTLDTVLYFSSRFGLLTDCFDRMRDGGMRQAVYRLQLSIDETPYFQIVLDSLDYAQAASANFVYDFGEAFNGEPRVRRLFRREGLDFAGSVTCGKNGGLVGDDSLLAYGPHTFAIVAEDAFGNRSELTGRFVWGPETDLYTLDSVMTGAGSSTKIYFTANPAVEHLNIVEIAVAQNRLEYWGTFAQAQLDRTQPGRLIITCAGVDPKQLVLRLQYLTREKCRIVDFPFSGMVTRGIHHPEITYELADDGMIVRGSLRGRMGYRAQLELLSGDSLLGSEPMPRFFSMNLYAFFVPAKPDYRRISRMQIRFASELGVEPDPLDSLHLVLAGVDDTTRLLLDDKLEFLLPKTSFFTPTYADLSRTKLLAKVTLGLASDAFVLGPQDLLTSSPFKLLASIPKTTYRLAQLGLCRLDKANDRWIWLGTRPEKGQRIGAESGKGGTFAIVFDDEPPKVGAPNLPQYRPIAERTPEITFPLSDNLSGIEDDRSITIKLDGTWMIPEYDPETKVCRTVPLQPLASGDHLLTIEAVDRAGNSTLKNFSFRVASDTPKAGKKK